MYKGQFQLFIMSKIEEGRMKNQFQGNADVKFQIQSKNKNIKKRKVKTWTTQEDELLIHLSQQYPKKWAIIATKMKDRNENQCLHRYRRLVQVGVQKKIWSEQQDSKVVNLIRRVGKNWKLLSQMLGTKTGKQIRERFINKLDPNIRNEEWTEDEDRLILKYYTEYGSHWSEISKQLPGRPENKIKNRFYSYIKKNYEVKFLLNSSKQQDKNILQVLQDTDQIALVDCQNQGSLKKPNKGNKSVGVKQKREQQHLSSLRQLEGLQNIADDLPYQQKQKQDNKVLIQSLIRVDEELPQIEEGRYHSIKSLTQNNDDIDSENDLFYLLNH